MKSKLTAENKEIAREMVIAGKSYAEIAQTVGVSIQRVHQLFPKGEPKYLTSARACVYQGIARYMLDEGINFVQLDKECGRRRGHFGYVLRGEQSIRKDDIDALLQVTGLTYESAFGCGTTDATEENTQHIDRDAWEPCNSCRSCENCKNMGDYDPYEGTFGECGQCYGYSKFEQTNFCHECGRPLTEAGWDELEKQVFNIKRNRKTEAQS